MNVYEMEGFLRGKCMPRDILVNESTAEYLVRKLNEATTVKAERDALERQLSMSEAKCKGYFSDAAAALVRCDALAVENAALKSKAAELVHEASEVYSACNATIKEPDGDFVDMQTLYEMQCIETPATSAALAAIEARGAIAAIESLIGKKKRVLAEMHPDTHAYGATEVIIRNQIRDLESFADELREAK